MAEQKSTLSSLQGLCFILCVFTHTLVHRFQMEQRETRLFSSLHTILIVHVSDHLHQRRYVSDSRPEICHVCSDSVTSAV